MLGKFGRRLLAVLIAIGAFVMLILRGRMLKAEAVRAVQEAKEKNDVIDLRRRVDAARETTTERHQEEKRDADERLAAGRRDHLDNTW